MILFEKKMKGRMLQLEGVWNPPVGLVVNRCLIETPVLSCYVLPRVLRVGLTEQHGTVK